MTTRKQRQNEKKITLAAYFRKHPVLVTIGLIMLGLLGINVSDISQFIVPNTAVVQESHKETYTFRNETYLSDHFKKHKDEFNYSDASAYLDGANRVIHSKEALHKLEAEDGDAIYYLEKTNELVVVSTDGYIRTYFKPTDGLAYFNRQ